MAEDFASLEQLFNELVASGVPEAEAIRRAAAMFDQHLSKELEEETGDKLGEAHRKERRSTFEEKLKDIVKRNLKDYVKDKLGMPDMPKTGITPAGLPIEVIMTLPTTAQEVEAELSGDLGPEGRSNVPSEDVPRTVTTKIPTTPIPVEPVSPSAGDVPMPVEPVSPSAGDVPMPVEQVSPVPPSEASELPRPPVSITGPPVSGTLPEIPVGRPAGEGGRSGPVEPGTQTIDVTEAARQTADANADATIRAVIESIKKPITIEQAPGIGGRSGPEPPEQPTIPEPPRQTAIDTAAVTDGPGAPMETRPPLPPIAPPPLPPGTPPVGELPDRPVWTGTGPFAPETPEPILAEVVPISRDAPTGAQPLGDLPIPEIQPDRQGWIPELLAGFKEIFTSPPGWKEEFKEVSTPVAEEIKDLTIKERADRLREGGLLPDKGTVAEEIGRLPELGDIVQSGERTQQKQRTSRLGDMSKIGGGALAGKIFGGSKIAKVATKFAKNPITVAVASVVLLSLAAISAAKALVGWTENVVESQRHLARYDGRMTVMIARLDYQQLRLDVTKAREVGPTAAFAGRGVEAMREQWAPIANDIAQIKNGLAGILANGLAIGGWLAKFMPLIQLLDNMAKALEMMAGKKTEDIPFGTFLEDIIAGDWTANRQPGDPPLPGGVPAGAKRNEQGNNQNDKRVPRANQGARLP